VELFEPVYDEEQLLLITQEKLLPVKNSLIEEYRFLEKSFEKYLKKEVEGS